MTHRNPRRIDHVLYCFWPDGLERALDVWRTGIGVEFEEVDLPASGLRILISWDAGIEMAAPVGAGPAADRMRAHLEAHGEGLRSVIFGVDDMDAAIARLERAGVAVASRDDYSALWIDHFAFVEEARLERVAHMDILLSEIRTSRPEQPT